MADERRSTETYEFGASRRENHDASRFYARFEPPIVSTDETVNVAPNFNNPCFVGDARDMAAIPDNSVALVVTSPPYFVGKQYEDLVASHEVPTAYFEYLEMLRQVFEECVRCLEPGGRIAINVANLGRKPYRSLSSDVIRILQDELKLLLRGEIIWQKAEGATGSVAWGSFRSAKNPVLRDLSERIIIASKGRFDRARDPKRRMAEGLPHETPDTKTNTDEFMEATLDIWRIDPESARRVHHPAPFPVELPQRLIQLYTYPGDLVLDPFMGSGTTLVAAGKSGRRGVGYDLDPEYADIARQRLIAEVPGVQQTMIDIEPTVQKSRSKAPAAVPDGENRNFQARASQEGKKAQDIAERVLRGAGFDIVKKDHAVRRLGVRFNFLVSDEADGDQWYVDVSGAFTTVRPGLLRSDTLWKTLGRAHVLHSAEPANRGDKPSRFLILTSNLPKPGSDGDRALRAVGPHSVFDALEMYDDAGLARLAVYATKSVTRPLPGFWSEDEIGLADPTERQS